MDYRHKNSRKEESPNDFPTYSRLFIIIDKRSTETQLQEAFSKFGTIEDIKMPRDHNTGDLKGIAFIKFSKTSEAARALEEMNRRVLPDSNRPLKVIVAANRTDIHTNDDDDDEKYKRLFITVPTPMSEQDIIDVFSEYGNVENVRLQKDRNTGESKGFAYVKYRKFVEAAHAFEESDKKFRVIFAMPKSQNRHQDTLYKSNSNALAVSSSHTKSLFSEMNTHPDRKGYCRVKFMYRPPMLPFVQVRRIFNIVPGMTHCQYFVDLMANCGKGVATYSNPASAAHAVDKLYEFEYPPGMKIYVKPDYTQLDGQEQKYNFRNMPNVVHNLENAITSSANASSPDLAHLTEAIAEASKLIKVATSGVSNDNLPDSNDLNYCSLKLPNRQPLADIDSPVAKRCFLVCKPQPPPLTVLRDVFCRFGNLINVYTLPGKTEGFARYATAEAANDAIKTLHGAEICGIRIKVLEAEEENTVKRSKYEP